MQSSALLKRRLRNMENQHRKLYERKIIICSWYYRFSAKPIMDPVVTRIHRQFNLKRKVSKYLFICWLKTSNNYKPVFNFQGTEKLKWLQHHNSISSTGCWWFLICRTFVKTGEQIICWVSQWKLPSSINWYLTKYWNQDLNTQLILPRRKQFTFITQLSSPNIVSF